ncbi:MAG TPA: ribonuclease P protein component [Stellaceae bacterium]|nr:ribonuclease P protein component [Stellaceae bacterium]
MAGLARLKRRAEFLHVAKGRRWTTPGLVLQARKQPDDRATASAARVGFTASRKVGIAVARNRARRRLRAAADRVLPDHAAPGQDYVVVARSETVKRPFALLVGDLETALKRLGAWRDAAAGHRGGTR